MARHSIMLSLVMSYLHPKDACSYSLIFTTIRYCPLHNVLASAQERSQTVEIQLSETTKQLHELRVRQRQLEARNALLEKVAKLNKQPSGEAPLEGSPSPTVPFSIQVCGNVLHQCCKLSNIFTGMHTLVCGCVKRKMPYSKPSCVCVHTSALLYCVLPTIIAVVQATQITFCLSHQADAERALSGVVVETDQGPVITFTIEDNDRVMTVDEVGKISSAMFQRLYSVCRRTGLYC